MLCDSFMFWQVAFIAPFKAQLKAVRRALPASIPDLQILTVDKCQGQDYDCCILSLVRSNARGEVGQLLGDWRRLNVAMTRARKKFFIVGSATTLRHSQLLACLLQLVDERGWVLELPPQAHVLYDVPCRCIDMDITAEERVVGGGPAVGHGAPARPAEHARVARDGPIARDIAQGVRSQPAPLDVPRRSSSSCHPTTTSCW
jgi:hypothetical protein